MPANGEEFTEAELAAMDPFKRSAMFGSAAIRVDDDFKKAKPAEQARVAGITLAYGAEPLAGGGWAVPFDRCDALRRALEKGQEPGAINFVGTEQPVQLYDAAGKDNGVLLNPSSRMTATEALDPKCIDAREREIFGGKTIAEMSVEELNARHQEQQRKLAELKAEDEKLENFRKAMETAMALYPWPKLLDGIDWDRVAEEAEKVGAIKRKPDHIGSLIVAVYLILACALTAAAIWCHP